MFLCVNCVSEQKKWLFNMPESFGACEKCKQFMPCIDFPSYNKTMEDNL